MIMNTEHKIQFGAILLIASFAAVAAGGPYVEPGMHMNDPNIVAWVEDCNVVRGFNDITNPDRGYASFGSPSRALGKATGDEIDVVSLGDDGVATLTFDESIYITNGNGNDFAVFENGFVSDGNNAGSGDFLELAFVKVSSDGINFFGFDAISLTPTNVQIGGFDFMDATEVYNLAGKHSRGFGSQFDLEELKDVNILLDVDSVTHIRIIDVVGFIEPADFNGDGIVNTIDFGIFATAYMSEDGDGNWNEDCDIYREWIEGSPPYYDDPDGIISLQDLHVFVEKWLNENDYASCDINGRQINDPWPTNFEGKGGFDLDAVGVMNTRARE